MVYHDINNEYINKYCIVIIRILTYIDNYNNQLPSKTILPLYSRWWTQNKMELSVISGESLSLIHHGSLL